MRVKLMDHTQSWPSWAEACPAHVLAQSRLKPRRRDCSWPTTRSSNEQRRHTAGEHASFPSSNSGRILAAAHLAVGAEQVHKKYAHLSTKASLSSSWSIRRSRLAGSVLETKVWTSSAGRDSSREVQLHAPQELGVAGHRRVRDAVALHLPKDVTVHKISGGAGNCASRQGTFESGHNALGERTCAVGRGRLKQRGMCLSEATWRHGFFPKLSAWLFGGCQPRSPKRQTNGSGN